MTSQDASPTGSIAISEEADLFWSRIINVRITRRHPSITVTLKAGSARGLTLKYFQSQIIFQTVRLLGRGVLAPKSRCSPAVGAAPGARTQHVSDLKDDSGTDQNDPCALPSQLKIALFFNCRFQKHHGTKRPPLCISSIRIMRDGCFLYKIMSLLSNFK